MRKTKVVEGRRCPKCGDADSQVSYGYNRAGTRRSKCKLCGTQYTLEPKNKTYSEDVRERAIRAYYSGVSGRGVGKMFGMSKANVYNWI